MDDGVAVLALAGGGDAAAELVGDELHTVADGEDGEAGVEDVGGGEGGAFVVDGGGAAGEDEAAGVKLLDLLPGGVEGDELAVDVTVTDSARDQHAILRAEIEDDDRFRLGRGWWFALAGLLTFALAGDLQVGGDLQVVGGGYPPIGGQVTLIGIGGGFGIGHGAGCPPFDRPARQKAGSFSDGSIRDDSGSIVEGEARRWFSESVGGSRLALWLGRKRICLPRFGQPGAWV